MKRTTTLTAVAVTAAAVAAIAYTAMGATAEPQQPRPAQGFYVNPNSAPAQWVAKHPADGRAAKIRSAIAAQPIAAWFGDTYTANGIADAVDAYVGKAAKAGQVPVLVAYDIPNRDACGVESAGGTTGADAYRAWISAFATGLGERPALVVLEPDALADFKCLSKAQAQQREDLLAYATGQLQGKATRTKVYLDAGNSHYASAADMAERLMKAGIGKAHGFSLNVSNFHPTTEETAFAEKLNADLAGAGVAAKPFVVDTSRNGKSSNGQWCNPAGRRLGAAPKMVSTKGTGLEARLWIKTPGVSDGRCGTAANVPAGTFDPTLADNLITGQ